METNKIQNSFQLRKRSKISAAGILKLFFDRDDFPAIEGLLDVVVALADVIDKCAVVIQKYKSFLNSTTTDLSITSSSAKTETTQLTTPSIVTKSLLSKVSLKTSQSLQQHIYQ